MKRIVLSALAVAAIASCTKNEVIPETNELQEITFRTIVGPQTKALGEGQVKYAGEAFYSTAFYLDAPKTWADKFSDAVVYLNDKIIKSGTEWKAVQSYYWPKGGKLTFMSYALLDAANKYMETTPTVISAAKTGVTVADFNVNTYKDYDLLVAKIASDKNANEKVYLTQGVPTLFGHKLCKLAITAQTDKAYTTKTFTIKSILINDLQSTGTYNMTAAGVESWGSYKNPDDVTFYTDGTGMTINNDADNTTKTTITASQSVYLPQNFQDTETITINYTITTGAVVETVSVTKKFSEIFTGNWEMNKMYSINITFGLNEILWDPAQTDWTDGADGSVSL